MMDGLEEWRKEAKEMQRQQEMKVFIEGRMKYPKATEKAPFATDAENTNDTSQQKLSPAQARLKVSDILIQTCIIVKLQHHY